MRHRLALALLCGSLFVSFGCERQAPLQFVMAPEVGELEDELQQAVRAELVSRTGTPQNIKLLGDADPRRKSDLARGAEVYQQFCMQCHGVTGDGNGPAAAYLNPKPRDYRKGIFKFTSTGYGNKPRREDLMNTIVRGVTGTSMPSFKLLSQRDLNAVVDYVLALTHRGELETLLVVTAQNEDEVTPEAADEMEELVLASWAESREQVVDPETKMPAFSEETIAAGQQIFQERECYKCHGRDGRGGIVGGIEVGTDAWGQKAAAADLTSGMLRGGSQPIDIYRRIYAGINGTPMPAFKEILADDPDKVWMLVHYVLHLSDQRRQALPTPGGDEEG